MKKIKVCLEIDDNINFDFEDLKRIFFTPSYANSKYINIAGFTNGNLLKNCFICKKSFHDKSYEDDVYLCENCRNITLIEDNSEKVKNEQ